jgi:hypothetical protein
LTLATTPSIGGEPTALASFLNTGAAEVGNTSALSDPYVLPVPSEHRTDWGEAFASALEVHLQELQPPNLDRERTGTFAESGGRLIVRLTNVSSGEAVEIRIWEDEAEVRWRNSSERFALVDDPDPPSWIPTAVEYVGRLLADGDFV